MWGRADNGRGECPTFTGCAVRAAAMAKAGGILMTAGPPAAADVVMASDRATFAGQMCL